jgi:hypothetical protein
MQNGEVVFKLTQGNLEYFTAGSSFHFIGHIFDRDEMPLLLLQLDFVQTLMACDDLEPGRESTLIIESLQAFPGFDKNILNQVICGGVVEIILANDRADHEFMVLVKTAKIQGDPGFASKSVHGDPRMIL